MDLNKVMLIGRVGKDPEIKTTVGEKMVASFSLATSNNGRDKKTTWHNITAWEKIAETVSKYVSKGSLLYIEGRIQNRSYKTQSGETKYITDVVASSLILLESKPRAPQEKQDDFLQTPF